MYFREEERERDTHTHTHTHSPQVTHTKSYSSPILCALIMLANELFRRK